MKNPVFVALCALLLITGANASCFLMRMKCTPGPYRREIPFRYSKCYGCTCLSQGNVVSCCLNVAIPIGYNRKKCSKVLDEDTCAYKVTRKGNSRRSCPVIAWSG